MRTFDSEPFLWKYSSTAPDGNPEHFCLHDVADTLTAEGKLSVARDAILTVRQCYLPEESPIDICELSLSNLTRVQVVGKREDIEDWVNEG